MISFQIVQQMALIKAGFQFHAKFMNKNNFIEVVRSRI